MSAVYTRSAKPLFVGSIPTRASNSFFPIFQELLYLAEKSARCGYFPSLHDFPAVPARSVEIPWIPGCRGPSVGLRAHRLSVLALALVADFVDPIHFGLLMVLRGVKVLLNLYASRSGPKPMPASAEASHPVLPLLRKCAEGRTGRME